MTRQSPAEGVQQRLDVFRKVLDLYLSCSGKALTQDILISFTELHTFVALTFNVGRHRDQSMVATASGLPLLESDLLPIFHALTFASRALSCLHISLWLLLHDLPHPASATVILLPSHDATYCAPNLRHHRLSLAHTHRMCTPRSNRICLRILVPTFSHQSWHRCCLSPTF